jgi:hypothetical protein
VTAGSVQPRRIAGDDGSVIAKSRTQLRQGVERRLGPRSFVAFEIFDALFALEFDRHNLFNEFAGLLGFEKTLLRSLGKAVLIPAGQLRVGDQILDVPSRMLAREGVLQPVAQHRVMDLGGAHAIAPATAVEHIGRAVHVAMPPAMMASASPERICKPD